MLKIAKLIFVVIVVAVYFQVSVGLAAEGVVVLNKKSASQSNYMRGLLELTLSHAQTKYQLQSTATKLSKSKVLASMKTGAISLTWGGTSEKLEQEFIPIRIDTYRGLMSHRLLFIREGQQAKFDQIKSAEDLKTIKFGQGRRWQDTKILQSAGLNVVTSNKKKNLYYMLEGQRFDAFPRGASEALTELGSYSDLPLTVEQNLVIVYPLPTYFFVSKQFPELAEDIELGFETILKNGQFDEYFYGSPEIRSTLSQANLKARRAIHIDNPFLPKETPLHRKELWLDLTKVEL
ncbi:diguanylate cyclase (plasmid) [Saccharobesus litoralis]|uniref:Diguanylate cyclase n=1 Tax=Saccharobesus litoralis TaxID=2172099 RepID=A0A2S0VY71_9ALTE|nr:diguanylate cyclase [Saccharobesus litoralis]AWB69169.1 diguanylate cyclase [Saccharobesus litoralis]